MKARLVRVTAPGSRSSHWAPAIYPETTLCDRATGGALTMTTGKPLCRHCIRLAKSEETA